MGLEVYCPIRSSKIIAKCVGVGTELLILIRKNKIMSMDPKDLHGHYSVLISEVRLLICIHLGINQEYITT